MAPDQYEALRELFDTRLKALEREVRLEVVSVKQRVHFAEQAASRDHATLSHAIEQLATDVSGIATAQRQAASAADRQSGGRDLVRRTARAIATAAGALGGLAGFAALVFG